MTTEPCSPTPSPFLFILNQLEAAERAAAEAAKEPPKRPRGRPPKVEEPPLLPGAIRHVLSDEDSEEDKRMLRLERKLELAATSPPPVTRQVPAKLAGDKLAVIVPWMGKYACLVDGEVFGTSKHPDYWEHHLAKGDLRKAASFSIAKFAHVDLAGVVESLVSAELLLKNGPKNASVDKTLTEAERSQVKAAITKLESLQ